MSTPGRLTLAFTVFSTVVFFACGGEGPKAPPTVDIVAEDHELTAPDSIRAGWTTFRMHNQGSEHHLFTFLRLPEGVTYQEFEQEVIASYDSVWSRGVLEGTIPLSEWRGRLGELLPEWSSELVQPGGISLTAPGRTAETTIRMEPGTYAMECYVKTPDGQFHALAGMVRPLTVVRDSSDAQPPESDHELTVSNLDLEGVDSVSAGEHTFAVHFEEGLDPTGDLYLHQHLHLARLEEENAREELTEWMDTWEDENPIMPAPVEFLGGAQHMPAGNTAYVNVELVPGRYGWVLGWPPEHGEVASFVVE